MIKIIILFIFILLILFLMNRKKETFNLNNELIILNNFYKINKFSRIKELLNNIQLKKDIRVSSRESLCLFKNDYQELYDLIYNDENLKKLIKNYFNKNFINNPDFPIEYRNYPNGSFGMNWHYDLSMFSPDCLEAVLTIDNNSDSKFLWEQNDQIKSIKPESNTLVIVKPNTILHKVSEVNGNRKILKFIIQFENSIKKPSFFREIQNCPK